MSNLVCYTIGLNYVTSSNQYFPCGASNAIGSSGAQSCCFGGDYCMQDSICHYTHSVANGTGYYMAGCTDPTWQDPECPKQCTSEYGADVIYDTTNSHWNCCVSSDGYLNCQDPSDFTVDAPAPQNLVVAKQLNTAIPSLVLTTGIGAISSVGSAFSGSSETTTTMGATITTSTSVAAATTSSSTSSTTIATGTPSDTNAATSSSAIPSATKDGLSGGAMAGIAIGCVVVVLLFIVAALLLSRRNKSLEAATAGGYGGPQDSREGTVTYYGSPTGIQRQPTYESCYSPSELMSPDQSSAGEKTPVYGMHELDAQRATAELSGSKFM